VKSELGFVIRRQKQVGLNFVSFNLRNPEKFKFGEDEVATGSFFVAKSRS
jgi:hypothetical protein